MSLERHFQQSDWTIGGLADAMHVSHETVRLWVRGHRPVTPTRALEFSRLTGIPPHSVRPDIYPPSPDLIAPAGGERGAA